MLAARCGRTPMDAVQYGNAFAVREIVREAVYIVAKMTRTHPSRHMPKQNGWCAERSGLHAIIKDTRSICFTKDIFSRTRVALLVPTRHRLVSRFTLCSCCSGQLSLSIAVPRPYVHRCPQKRQVPRHRAAMSRGLGCLHATWMACRSTIAGPLRATSVLGQQTRLCATSPEDLEHKKVGPIRSRAAWEVCMLLHSWFQASGRVAGMSAWQSLVHSCAHWGKRNHELLGQRQPVLKLCSAPLDRLGQSLCPG